MDEIISRSLRASDLIISQLPQINLVFSNKLAKLCCLNYQTQPHLSVRPYPKTFIQIIFVLLGFTLLGTETSQEGLRTEGEGREQKERG